MNYGSIAGNYGVYLTAGGSVSNQSSASISGFFGILGGSTGAVTVVNHGIIAGSISLSNGTGIALRSGNVTNQSFASISGLIGINGSRDAMTVVNYGSITGNTTSGTGVALSGGGSIANQSSATISGRTGIYGGGTSATTVLNYGSISGNPTSGDGILLRASGSVTNQSSASISGDTGIYGGPTSAVTIMNYGSVAGNPTSGSGILLFGAGSVTNQSSASISGDTGVYGGDAGVTVINAGDITGLGTNGFGVDLRAGGLVNNAASGTIAASQLAGIFVTGAVGTVLNAGVVMTSGTTSIGTRAAVALLDGGYIGNAGGGTISGFVNPGVYIIGGAGTVLNGGVITIAGGTRAAVALQLGGYVSNAGTGTISANGGIGVAIQGATGTLINAGVITRSGAAESAVDLLGGGYVSNAATGTVSTDAHSAVYVSGQAGTVVNAGTIVGGSFGVHFTRGGAITNQSVGTIGGDTNGIFVTGAAGTVANAGELVGTLSYGIDLKAGGSVTNRSAGTISGGVSGVDIIGGAATVTNAGTIAGGADAMLLAEGFADRSVVDPGAVFSGSVNGGNVIGTSAVSTLELASGSAPSTLSGLGRQFINFAQVTVDAGANWMLIGYNTLATGGTLTNSGSLTVASGGTLVISGAVAGTGVAQIDNNATLELGGSFAAGGTVSFAGTGPATLILDDPADFQGTIANFQPSDTIDFSSVGTASALYNGSSLTLELPNGQTETLQVSGILTGTSPFLQSDGNHGTDLTFDPTGMVQIATVIYSNVNPGVELGFGSGIVIGPHSILTAAHVVWSASQDQSATSIEIAPYGSSGSASIFGTLQPFVGQPTAYNTAEASLGTIGSITGVYFDAVDDPGSALYPASYPFDLAVIDTSADLTQYVQIGTNYAVGTVDLVGQLGSFGAALSYSAESDVSASSGLLIYQAGSFVPNPYYTFSPSPVAEGMSGGPALIDTADGLQDVGVISNILDAVQLTSSNWATIQGWENGVLCFCRGTRILTDRGQVAVEDLTIGDPVITMAGEAKPITWIGFGRVLVAPGRRSAATPILVCKGALADNVPHRDLRITKGHSLFLDDVLIPAEFLVNHRSILWDDRAGQVEFYHIELATHDVLLADGAPAESYRDDGNRWLFQNANSGWEQPPKPPCAPVLTGGPVVDAVWRRLLDRAGPRPGLPLTDEPDLHLLVDGRRVDGSYRPGGYSVFDLPRRPSELRVASRAGSPAELGLARDPRLLGVAVRQIRLWRGARLRLIEASDPSLDEGFHLFEADNGFRWTDGDARLPASLFDGVHGACELELSIASTTQYPLLGDPAQADAA